MIDHIGDEQDLTRSTLHINQVEPALGQLDSPLLDTCHVLGVKPAGTGSDPDHEPCDAGVGSLGSHHDVAEAPYQ
ncbi:MAG TPA: hypothetical protein VGK17_01700 [Propionicimonas sp.]